MFFYGDPTGMLLVIITFGFAMWAQSRVQSTFKKYSRVPTARGMTGAEVARSILDANQLYDVQVEMIAGRLSDHYDPRVKKLRLSTDVYQGTSVASVGVAAHETGHAIQHALAYVPLKLRDGFLPVAQFGSHAAMPLFLIGLFFNAGILLDLGILLFMAAVAFQVITLPVEFNASNRAVDTLIRNGYIDQSNEAQGVRAVLSAAALTYIGATAVAVAQLARLMLLRNSRRR
jgi:Zn-dependent membrane protease YugP